MREQTGIAVVIPSYRVRNYILDVLTKIGDEVDRIYLVDDCCPEGTALFVKNNYRDKRLTIIRHDVNQGVGGAVMTGYLAAIADNMKVIVS